ncbi:hypothetical protein [Vibrio nigripulchritudo]|uniref:hypothetical protein n=1 Tax=Vibrio nigripulchritudo TaxID=28173 RepID=UPI0005FA727F|nr:hypothetical protein [Vibrio nigripulchritudo]KJY75220.1 hypothetical protein TW74_17955 [Vibrio nigripulchritudo]
MSSKNKSSTLYLFVISNVLAILGTVIYLFIIWLGLGDKTSTLSSYEVSIYGVLLLEATPSIVISTLILLILRNKASETPAKIRKLIGYDMTLRVVTFLISYAYFNLKGAYDPSPFFNIFLSWIYYAFWVQYFTSSKKVFAIYGANSPKTLPH